MGLVLGSAITVQLARGDPLRLSLSGVYAKSDLISGFMVPLSAVTNFTVSQPTIGFIQVRDAAAVNTVKSEVDALLNDNPEVTVGNRSEYLEQQTSSADRSW